MMSICLCTNPWVDGRHAGSLGNHRGPPRDLARCLGLRACKAELAARGRSGRRAKRRREGGEALRPVAASADEDSGHPYSARNPVLGRRMSVWPEREFVRLLPGCTLAPHANVQIADGLVRAGPLWARADVIRLRCRSACLFDSAAPLGTDLLSAIRLATLAAMPINIRTLGWNHVMTASKTDEEEHGPGRKVRYRAVVEPLDKNKWNIWNVHPNEGSVKIWARRPFSPGLAVSNPFGYSHHDVPRASVRTQGACLTPCSGTVQPTRGHGGTSCRRSRDAR